MLVLMARGRELPDAAALNTREDGQLGGAVGVTVRPRYSHIRCTTSTLVRSTVYATTSPSTDRSLGR